jgi:hypothetical protein
MFGSVQTTSTHMVGHYHANYSVYCGSTSIFCAETILIWDEDTGCCRKWQVLCPDVSVEQLGPGPAHPAHLYPYPSSDLLSYFCNLLSSPLPLRFHHFAFDNPKAVLQT